MRIGNTDVPEDMRLRPSGTPDGTNHISPTLLGSDVIEDQFEHAARVEDVLVRDRAGAGCAARHDRIADGAVLAHILLVELVDLAVRRAATG